MPCKSGCKTSKPAGKGKLSADLEPLDSCDTCEIILTGSLLHQYGCKCNPVNSGGRLEEHEPTTAVDHVKSDGSHDAGSERCQEEEDTACSPLLKLSTV